MNAHRLTFVCLIFGLCSAAYSAEPTPEELQFFETKIRPVLVNSCYKCHSAKAKANGKLEAELLLDTREGTRLGGESGPAVVPGDLEKSLLIQAIRHTSFEMPPKSKLADNVIADFEKWVKSGAADPREGKVELEAAQIDIEAGRKHWAFQPLTVSPLPDVAQQTWCRNEIDRFILSSLEAQQIPPNPSADRRVLIRRSYFDVCGLPPEPADVELFVNDPDPQAYEKLTEQLLSSEHFGERWARHWLDLARFAESNGYAFDKDRPAAYHYRDFVIKAFNQDMPYDEFIRLQIAGDLLGGNDEMAQAATGLLASGPFTSQQTQKERERSRYEQLDDLIATVGTTTLGLTLGCARCHDHKFDPIPSRDYYRLVSSFAEVGFQDFQFDRQPEKYRTEKTAFDAEHKPYIDARLNYEKETLPAKLSVWMESRPTEAVQPKLSDWHHAGPFPAESFDKAYDQKFPPEKKIKLVETYLEGQVKWVSRREWKDETVHNTLTGENSANYLFRTITAATEGPLEISLGRDDGIRVWLNGKSVLNQKVMGGAAPDQDKVKLTLKSGRNELLLKIINGAGPSGFYFKALPTGPPKNIADILKLEDDKRNDQQNAELLKWYAPYDEGWQMLNQPEQTHLELHPKQDLMPIFAASKGGTTYNFGADTRKVYFLSRGNSNAKQGLATPGFLQVLTTTPEAEKEWLIKQEGDKETPQAARIAFADWLVDHEQGAGKLLARVIVNRLWQHYTGRGIVSSPSDFGTQGERPSHPELLDFLASRLIAEGWRLKPIHRLILNSSAYRQGNDVSSAGLERDPENQLFWRHEPRRIEAEIVRDTLLSVSGELDEKMYGPGSLKQEDRRRSVYLTMKRGSLIPFLQLFDAPDAMQGIGQRNATTVPPQALAMMNSLFVRSLAEKFAQRISTGTNLAEDNAIEKVVSLGYQIALARAPSESELATMTQFIKQQAASYGATPQASHVAVTDFCQLMFCLNEFLFID